MMRFNPRQPHPPFQMKLFSPEWPESKAHLLESASYMLFEQRLLAYAKNKDRESFDALKKLMGRASQNGWERVLNLMLNSIRRFHVFQASHERDLFLQEVLLVFFKQVTSNQLATLFMNGGYPFLQELLELREQKGVEHYFFCFKKLLNAKLVSSRQYESVVLAPQVLQRLAEEKTKNVSQVRTYLKGLSPLLLTGQIRCSPCTCLRLLRLADFPVAMKEAQLIQAQLGRLKDAYHMKSLSSGAYFLELTLRNELGLTLLHQIVSLNYPWLVRTYLKCLAEVANAYDLEQLLESQGTQHETCLHALAATGSLEILDIFIDFLIRQEGTPKAQVYLSKLAQKMDKRGELAAFPAGAATHPMNCILEFLRSGKLGEALANLRTAISSTQAEHAVLPRCYSAFLTSGQSLFFFNETVRESAEREHKPVKELQNAEVYLSQDLVEVLNNPPDELYRIC